ncbi:extracellular solute-binding protein [Pseudonocardiaceae bacterium YIM PH 21723]|nr:extracellular solute-binding protein [Pseudonocardiaceae bacterium YIM PH 21723]
MVLSLATVLTLLAGCSLFDKPPAPAAQEDIRGTEIEYLYVSDGNDAEVTRDLVAKYQDQTGAKINLKPIDFNDVGKELDRRRDAGEMPDLARIPRPGLVRGDLADLRPYLKDAKLVNAFVPGAIKGGTGPQGEVFGLPSDITVSGPLVNLDLFAQAGETAPSTKQGLPWPELVALAQKVQKATGVKYAIAMDHTPHRLVGMLSQWGVDLFTPDGKAALDVDKAAKALDYFIQINKNDTSTLWLTSKDGHRDAAETFKNQEAVFYLSGNWKVGDYAQQAKFNWESIPNPCQVRCGGYPGGKFTVVFKEGKQPAVAAAFAEWLASRENQAQFVGRSLFMPSRKDLATSGLTYPQRQDDMNVYLGELNRVPAEAFASTGHPLFDRAASAVMDSAMKALKGQLTSRQAAEESRKAIEDITKQTR